MAEKIRKSCICCNFHSKHAFSSEYLLNKYLEFGGDTIPFSCFLFLSTFLFSFPWFPWFHSELALVLLPTQVFYSVFLSILHQVLTETRPSSFHSTAPCQLGYFFFKLLLAIPALSLHCLWEQIYVFFCAVWKQWVFKMTLMSALGSPGQSWLKSCIPCFYLNQWQSFKRHSSLERATYFAMLTSVPGTSSMILKALNLICSLCDQLQRNTHTLIEESMKQR